MNPFPTSNLLLKHQPELFERILNKKLKPIQILELLLLSVVGLAAFGAVMSIIIPHWWHAFNLMWKMLVLIFGSYALCVPALYVFSSIRGSRITLVQLLLFLTASISTTAVVLLSLSPIAWFFTWSTDNNSEVIRVMNTLMIGFGIVFGIILLARGFQAGYKHYKEQYPENKSAADILLLWLILVIVVTVQMSQKLGPWYAPSDAYCVGATCFPRFSEGSFTELPIVYTDTNQTAVVEWTLPESSCDLNALDYKYGDHLVSSQAESCVAANGQLKCTARVTDSKDVVSGTNFQMQTYNHCEDATYISPVVTYVKP